MMLGLDLNGSSDKIYDFYYIVSITWNILGPK